jgi:ketosteroid isomerase-like protein
MTSVSENVAKLKNAYELWDKSKGTDTTMWTALFAENVRLRSLAAGRPGLEFTQDCHSSNDVARYFAGLAGEWEMIHYTSNQFAVDGDQVVMLGSTSWKHKKTGKRFDTPKVDLVTFRDGRIVEFFEFYDTEKVLAAARP